MPRLHRLHILAALSLLLGSLLTAQAADPLATVRIIHIKYQANAELKNCKAAIANAIAAQKLGVASVPVQADAILLVKLDVQGGSLRSQIRWGAILEDHDGKRLYSTFGEESSWTADAACEDFAADLAEDLKDDIRNARLMGY